MADEKRLIDANELVPYLWALFRYFGSLPCSEADKATQRAIKRCIGEVKKMPTVDAVEAVHGEWMFGELGVFGASVKCSNCGYGVESADPILWVAYQGHKFCGACGAKMDGDGNA